MKKTSFIVGILSGIFLAQWWRVLIKEGIKAGIVASHKIEELSQVAREELEDVAAEATEELAKKG